MKGFLELIQSHSSAISAIATVIIAFFSMVSFYVAYQLSKDNRLLRKAGTEPKVVAYLLPDQIHFVVINLVVANVGQGAAKNVRFRIEADSDEFKQHGVDLKVNVDSTPIPMLPQGERVVTFFETGPNLFKEPRLKPFKIIASYENIRGKRLPEDVYEIDVSQFDGIVRIGTPPEHEIAEALKKIAADISRWNNSGRLRVETITTEERGRLEREQLEALRKAHADKQEEEK